MLTLLRRSNSRNVRQMEQSPNVEAAQGPITHTKPTQCVLVENGGYSKSTSFQRCIGSPGRTRTADLVVNSHVLYQLSYRGKMGMTIDTLCDDSEVLWEGQPPPTTLVKLLTR